MYMQLIPPNLMYYYGYNMASGIIKSPIDEQQGRNYSDWKMYHIKKNMM